ncbi:MAG: DJ-1/PfpI family protein, partial [Kiritimatiellae bacterium]|nr:DJ-1/PfpI family protein [Kiritimatiellia bacterium]
MAKKALFILADGFEETEAILPIDILNRTGVEVTTATLGDDASAPVAAAHGTRHLASTTLDEALARPDGFDAIVLPGGMPGTVNLRNDS